MSRKVAVGVFAMLFATTVFAQPSSVDSNAVESTYQAISRLDTAGQKAMFATLKPEMKGAIWTYQFEAYDAAHPELTPEQHRVIAQATFLIDTGLFREVYPDGRYAMAREIEAIAAATRAVFPKTVASGIFARLGIPEAGVTSPSPFLSGDDCSCNVAHDFCDLLTGSSACGRVPLCKRSDNGCGWAFVQACDGTCS